MKKLNGSIYYSKPLKNHVIKEILSGKITKEQARRLYDIKGKSTVLKWMRQAGLAECPPNHDICLEMTSDRSKGKGKSKSRDELTRRIRSLEKELEEAKLKAEAYSVMINIAEQEFKIPIRKKSNTKQSNK